ncbi:hypothetical protein Tco_0761262 [Tanacetum coccineum]
MSGSQDEIPPPPPPPSSSQTPTQQTPHTVSTIKLPILKKGEYDIWAMKMEHYLAHTDYPIWEVIQNGNGPVSITTDTQGQIKVLPPRTAEEILARERERKARTTLLMALPEDHLAKFHKMTDAKEMWDAIKSRFGGNDESKKMQKYILKQQFEGFSVSNSEGLHKGYDRFQSLLSQLEIHGAGVDSLSFDDLYNNLRVFENEYEQTSSYSLLANQSSCPQLDHEDLEQLDEFDLEEMDLKWQVVMISMRMKKFYKKTGRKLQFDAKEPNSGNKDGRRSGKQEDSKALVTIDGEGLDWTSHSEEEEDYALMACNSPGSDTEREQLSDASIEIKAYTQGLKKVEAQLVAHQQGQLWYEEKIRFMKIDLDDKTDVLTYHKKLLAEAQKEKEYLKAKVEKWHNSFKDLGKLLNTQMSANDKFGLWSQPSESETQTSDFDTCESDCSVETHESLPEPTVNEPKVVNQPKVWSDAPIIEEYESDSEDEHVSQPTKEQEQPSFASTNKQVKTPRETVKNQFTHSKNPTVDKKGLGYGFTARACFVCGSLSHLIRDCDFHEMRMAKQAELNNSIRKKSINTARASGTNNVSTARHNFNRQAVPTNAAMNVNTVKPIVNRLVLLGGKGKLLLSPQQVVIGDNKDITGTKSPNTMVDQDYPHRALKNKGIVDSGCSRHMTRNKAYLVEYQDFNGGPVAFGGSKGYITGKSKIKTGKLDFEDVCFVKEL